MGLEGGKPSRTLSHVIKGAFPLMFSHFTLFHWLSFSWLFDMLLLGFIAHLVREVVLGLSRCLSLSVPLFNGRPASWYPVVPYRSSCKVSSHLYRAYPSHVLFQRTSAS